MTGRANARNRADDSAETSAPQYPIESVDNALRLLLMFVDRPRVRLTDVSNYLGVASSTAHRLLAMLQYRGFVRQEASSRAYVPGGALNTIAAAINRHLDVRSRARPVLESLNAELGETVHLGRLERGEVTFLDSIESPRAVRVVSRAGRSMPANCTSTGKAMLSTLDTATVKELFPNEDLPALTDNSIRTRAELIRELTRVRRRGYATSDEESEDGVASVTIPVIGGNGAVYGLNVSVPTNRMSAPTKTRILDALRPAAAELENLLA